MSDEELPAKAQQVLAVARDAGLDVTARRYPEGTRTAEDAARAIGCDVAAIVKSLVFVDDDGPFLVLCSGANRVDLTAVEAVLDAGRVRRADADTARAATGFVIGGTPPLGHPSPLRVLMDEELLRLDEVWAAAGTPDTVFGVEPHALRAAAGAEVVALAAAR